MVLVGPMFLLGRAQHLRRVCILACGFAIRWIPETRARTLEQIEGELVLPRN
jgi:hypothetical protein